MVDANTDFFKIVDNFAKTAHVHSIPIIEGKLDFMPKVTIAIPTYKRAYLLKEAIDSAIAQVGYDEFDIIIVDNNPERNCDTEKLMQSYNHPKLSYYKNSENIQMTGNWNRCFELAKGNHIVLLHDDDILLPNFLREGMKILNHHCNIGILKPKNFIWNNGFMKPSITEIPKLNSKLKQLYDISFYYGQIIGVPSGIFYKRKNVLIIGGFNQEFFPTSDFCLMVMFSKHFKVYTLNQYLSIYRISENESFNISTLNGFTINDYFLLSQLLKTHNIPKFIINGFLRHRTKNNAIANRKKWNPEFFFNMNTLNIKQINQILGKFYHSIIRCYLYTVVFYYKISNK